MSLLDEYEQHLAQQPAPDHSLLDQVQATFPMGLNEQVYQQYLADNRIHQTESLDILKQNTRGQVIIPTGTGKTRIQIAYLVGDMIEKYRANTRGTYVIASHRLLLNKQLMDEFQDLCIRCGLPINVLYVGSARQDDKKVYDKYFEQGITSETYQSTFTTKGSDIVSFQTMTRQANRHLLIVSTYHSFDKLDSLDALDVCCYDEAHNTLEKKFAENIRQVLPKICRNFFFTATRKIGSTPEILGMENQDIYGNVLCEVSPRTMIDRAEIVTPRITTMMLDNDTPRGVVSDKNQHMLIKTIKEAFFKNRELVRSNSSNPSAIGAKLLVSFAGSDEIALVQGSKEITFTDELYLVQNCTEFKAWCEQEHVRVFSLSSRHGSFMDFKKVDNRNSVYDAMRELRDDEDAILLHIDILAEGIDLPSITGVLPLRHLNEIKLFQTFGRALRLMKGDRQRVYSGELLPENKRGFIKPYAYLILPLHFKDMDTSSDVMKNTIKRIFNLYGIPVEGFLPPEGFIVRDPKPLDPVTDWKKIAKIKKNYPLRSVVEDFIMETFLGDLPTESRARYQALMDLLEGDDNA